MLIFVSENISHHFWRMMYWSLWYSFPDMLNDCLPQEWNISHITWFSLALFCCGYVINHQPVYVICTPKFSGLLHWHWSNIIVWPTVNQLWVTRTFPNQNTHQNVSSFYNIEMHCKNVHLQHGTGSLRLPFEPDGDSSAVYPAQYVNCFIYFNVLRFIDSSLLIGVLYLPTSFPLRHSHDNPVPLNYLSNAKRFQAMITHSEAKTMYIILMVICYPWNILMAWL